MTAGSVSGAHRPRLDASAVLIGVLKSCYPGVAKRVGLDSLLAIVAGLPEDDRAAGLLALVDWRIATGRDRLGVMLGIDPPAITRMVLRGRAALARAGLRPDGSPTGGTDDSPPRVARSGRRGRGSGESLA